MNLLAEPFNPLTTLDVHASKFCRGILEISAKVENSTAKVPKAKVVDCCRILN